MTGPGHRPSFPGDFDAAPFDLDGILTAQVEEEPVDDDPITPR